MSDIKILLVDDHEVVRKGMKFLLEDESGIKVIGEASGGQEAIDIIPNLNPDLLLLDINMPEMSGIEAAKIITKKYPTTKILMFSMHNDPDYILKSIENGVDGYILKDSEKEEIIEAIKTINNGQKYFPTNISSILVNALQTKGNTVASNVVKDKLSKKENIILKMISQGLSSKEIAKKLELSIRTVSNHRANMLKKTGLNNTAELIRIASNEGGI